MDSGGECEIARVRRRAQAEETKVLISNKILKSAKIKDMTKESAIKLFEQKQIRSVWNDEEEKWYFSIVDVISILTDQPSYQRARNYWKVMKTRLVKEGNETVTNCNRLKLTNVELRFTE